MEVNRWAPLLASGSRLAAEVTRAWGAVKAEAEQCCAFLEKELPEVFTPETEGFGQGATGETRRRIIGGYGEGSDGVKSMLDNFGESRLRKLGLAKGTPEALKELGQVTGYLRRRLSSAVIRANVRCLLERMLQVGEGVGQAGRRRQWARQEEERARWEREGQWLARVTGRNLARRGDFPTP